MGRWADGHWVFPYLPTCRPAYLPSLCLCALLVIFLALAGASRALAQTPPPTDVIGMHDLSPGGTSPIKGTLAGSCLYCHAPHGGVNGTAGVGPTPLWNQRLSIGKTYTVYSSTTMTLNSTNPTPPLGSDTTLCLSCHDGTVAGSPGVLGSLVAYGKATMTGKMNVGDVFNSNLSTMHPVSFNLPLNPAPDLVTSLTAPTPSTADKTGAVQLINGNVECTSCHNPHVQSIIPGDPYFLVIDNTNGALCTACHSTVPSGTGMGLTSPQVASQAVLRSAATLPAAASSNSKPNPLAGWSASIHATASNRVPSQVSVSSNPTFSKVSATGKAQATLGSYGTVGRNACASCHSTHHAAGSGSLLRAADDQTCIICHNGSSTTSPPTSNILAEMVTPKYGHAFSPGNSQHLAHEPALLNQNRHVSCVDCHNPHSTDRVTTFPVAPAIRPSQALVVGISALDGKTVVNPASSQYENCLRCHGTSTGKVVQTVYGYSPVWAVSATDPLNVIPQFSTSATSSHPVFHDRTSPLPQPSLRANMLNLNGMTVGRSMGTRILCTDCHNSDDDREFGGSGPSGPHGSIFPHIMERRYEFSQAGAPGKLVTNLFPHPSLSAQGGASGGPYALCAKCHDLAQIMNNTSFSEHARHVMQDGFSCSACHTAHGMGAQTPNVSGERLVNFDLKVVAPNGATPVSYNRVSNSCSLVCHNHTHQLRSAGAGKTGIR